MTEVNGSKGNFNWTRFGKNMQKLSQTLLQGTVLMATTRSNGCYGPMGGSIWTPGCCSRNYGYMPPMSGCGIFGGYFPTPSPYITDPMYMADTTNPMLLQQGAFNCEAFVDNWFTQREKERQALQTTTTEHVIGQKFETELVDKGEYTFVNQEWLDLNKKADKTEAEEEKLKTEYEKQLGALAKSWTSFIDKSHGNNDSKITLEEFSKYIKTRFEDKNYTDEQIKRIFDKISQSDDEENISVVDAAITLDLLDSKDGKIKNETFEGFIDGIATEEIN